MTRPAKKPDDKRVAEALVWLKRRGTKKNVLGMARYAIRADKVFGVSVADIRAYAKRLGRDHELAAALWATGWYEARMMASFVDDPAVVTSDQMDAWSGAFDNWAICDTICFHLFDKSPLAWRKVKAWTGKRDEFVKRAGFALLASVAVHDKKCPDQRFLDALPIIEREATDGRNFVKKSVSWALRGIGGRNPALHKASVAVAKRLAASEDSSARWIGKDAVKDLASAATAKRVARGS
jgi:3-methyladenine DNA glycosylase AlkD